MTVWSKSEMTPTPKIFFFWLFCLDSIRTSNTRSTSRTQCYGDTTQERLPASRGKITKRLQGSEGSGARGARGKPQRMRHRIGQPQHHRREVSRHGPEILTSTAVEPETRNSKRICTRARRSWRYPPRGPARRHRSPPGPGPACARRDRRHDPADTEPRAAFRAPGK